MVVHFCWAGQVRRIAQVEVQDRREMGGTRESDFLLDYIRQRNVIKPIPSFSFGLLRLASRAVQSKYKRNSALRQGLIQ
jgi:hypothetical protein